MSYNERFQFVKVPGSDQSSSLALLGPRTALRAVGLARLEPLQDALSVEHVAARDGRELVGGREELEAGGAADPHDDDDLIGMLGLEKSEEAVGSCGGSVLLPKYVDVFPARHLLPLLDPQFVGDVVKPLDLVQERRYRQVSELLMSRKIVLNRQT